MVPGNFFKFLVDKQFDLKNLIRHLLNRCFEVLGYDVMIDSNLNPWIIEVNHLPRYVLNVA